MAIWRSLGCPLVSSRPMTWHGVVAGSAVRDSLVWVVAWRGWRIRLWHRRRRCSWLLGCQVRARPLGPASPRTFIAPCGSLRTNGWSLFSGGPKPPGSVTYWKGCSSMLACALWRSARMSSSTSDSGGGTSAAPCVRSAPLLVPLPWRSRLSAGWRADSAPACPGALSRPPRAHLSDHGLWPRWVACPVRGTDRARVDGCTRPRSSCRRVELGRVGSAPMANS